MKVAAVIIPHYNDTSRLMKCLAALKPQLTPEIEVIVVDNDSTEPLDLVRQKYPEIPIIKEVEKGAAIARNRGVTETTAPLLLFLDSDCIPQSNWIEVAMNACKDSDIVGGEIIVFDETPGPKSGAEAFEAVFAFDNQSYIENKGFSVTANLVTKRKIFYTVGGFRSGMSEDLDWCRRATACGYKLTYSEALKVSHPSRSDWTAISRKWQRLTHEAWGLTESNISNRFLWASRATMMPLSILIHTPRILQSPKLDNSRERWFAWIVLIRLRLFRGKLMLWQAITK